jgi:hypothetical protein
MRPELLQLINDYQQYVAKACRLLREHLHEEDSILGVWQTRKIPQRGFLDDSRTIRYFFHGIGCRVEFGSIMVDFDFGPDERHDGFDAWRLSRFAKTVATHASFVDHNQLHEELKRLHEAGTLVHLTQTVGGHLFFFPDTNHSTTRTQND